MDSRKSKILLHDDPRFKMDHLIHKLRKKRAVATIDRTPKPISIRHPINEMKTSKESIQRTNNMNKRLLQSINTLSRNGSATPTTDCFQDRHKINLSKLFVVRERLSRVESENLKIGSRILKTKSLTDTRLDSIDFFKDNTEFKIPPRVLLKYRSLIYPQDAAMLEKLLRPKIYLDITIKDLRPVGRVFVQLFTEACPDVVLELVHYCTFCKLDKLDIIRIFPMLWTEVELQCRSDSPLKNPNFGHEMNVQSHLHPGVLSFSSAFLEGFHHGLINFTISFRPLYVPDGTRLSFGLVTKGQRVLNVLQDYGTKNGVTKKDILIVNSGRID